MHLNEVSRSAGAHLLPIDLKLRFVHLKSHNLLPQAARVQTKAPCVRTDDYRVRHLDFNPRKEKREKLCVATCIDSE